jgi:hypothetical protein
MALTWADFNNGESALSIRTKLNTFNNATVTETTSISTAVNNNATAIAANAAAIATNVSDIADNAADIAAVDARTTVIETKLADYNVFGTLYGVYTTPKTYNLTTSYQDLANFASTGSHLVTVSGANGTFTPTHTAFYKVSLFLTGTTSESSEKVATVALVEDGVVLMSGSAPYIAATGINMSFSGIFPFTAGKEYKIQLKGNTTGTINVTADNFAIHHVGD